MCYYIIKTLTVCYSLWFISLVHAIQETTVLTCVNEVFEARCPYKQGLFITQARYGHIEASRCVDDVFADLGLLGCYANVTELIGSRCNKQTRCSIDVFDPAVMASKSCRSGLPMYMDITYVCISDTLSIQSCNQISVSRQMQYLLSTDIWDHHCFYDLEQNVNVDFSAEINLKIKMNIQHVSGQPFNGDEVYAIHGDGDRSYLFDESMEFDVDHLTLTLTNQHSTQLIGFQAVGCDDLATPAYAWVSRERDVTTVGCYHSDYEWKMTCVGFKWIGPQSNCTDKQQVLIDPTPTPERVDIKQYSTKYLTTDILFALIIGVTILLCAIVVTIGYVCLKRSKYTYEAKSAPFEMATMMSDPSNTATWQKAKLQGNNDTLILPVNSLQGQTLQLR
ncbi:hypothetical protein CAPTEDRAFT_203612 [Capitella teleta]|uniref:SUEL-type lectin domain-containing protein n=1 Tax=Capitella teleta TaxID=283909 RepID=R7U4M7_CAPTE|nr:hypothetical protein CAPTEDRAFT_203612 [Capitella teleta]|eukprot:ELU01056.1 hypothetical protein CAPTEDRAFT_203612 [Capitella teleta]